MRPNISPTTDTLSFTLRAGGPAIASKYRGSCRASGRRPVRWTVRPTFSADRPRPGESRGGWYTAGDRGNRSEEVPVLSTFGPIAVFFVVAAIFPIVPLVLARFLAPHRP